MKKIFRLFLFAPILLTGCMNEKPYNGQKIALDYVEEGTLVNSSVSEMKTIAFDNKVDSIFYIGSDECTSCVTLKKDIAGWCVTNHANVYNIDYSSVTAEDLAMLKEITAEDTSYNWTDESSIPAVYFMMEGYIIFRGGTTNTIKYLNRYVEVKDTTSSANQ